MLGIFIVFAQETGKACAFLVKLVDNVINPIIAVLFAAAVVVFLWGVFLSVYKADEEDARSQGKQNMFWGVIGIAIMVAAQSILAVVKNLIGGGATGCA